MKIIITENKFKDILKLSIIDIGLQSTIDNVGGWDNICIVFKIDSPMDFLHLFDDLEQVQSKANADWTLFRYKKGHNFMIYDRKIDKVYINYDEIWSFLSNKFGLNHTKIKSLTQEWLDETHNLRGVTTGIFNDVQNISLDEVYSLK